MKQMTISKNRISIRLALAFVILVGAISCRQDSVRRLEFTPGWSVLSEEDLKKEPDPVEPLGPPVPDYVPVRREWKEIPGSAYIFGIPGDQTIAKWKKQFEKANDADSVWFNDFQRCEGMERWLAANDLIELWFGPNRISGQDDTRTLWRLLQYDPYLEEMPYSKGDRVLHINEIIDTLLDYDAGSQFDINLQAGLGNRLHEFYCRMILKAILQNLPAGLQSALQREEQAWLKYYGEMSDVYEHLFCSPDEWNGSARPMYQCSFLWMHLMLRQVSLENLMLILLDGKEAVKAGDQTKEVVTAEMIASEFKQYAEEVDEEYGYPKTVQKKSLDNDQRLWKAWMASRSAVSAKLPEEERAVYDNCTETLYRYKLIMLKNRYDNPDDWSDPEGQGLLVFDSDARGCSFR